MLCQCQCLLECDGSVYCHTSLKPMSCWRLILVFTSINGSRVFVKMFQTPAEWLTDVRCHPFTGDLRWSYTYKIMEGAGHRGRWNKKVPVGTTLLLLLVVRKPWSASTQYSEINRNSCLLNDSRWCVSSLFNLCCSAPWLWCGQNLQTGVRHTNTTPLNMEFAATGAFQVHKHTWCTFSLFIMLDYNTSDHVLLLSNQCDVDVFQALSWQRSVVMRAREVTAPDVLKISTWKTWTTPETAGVAEHVQVEWQFFFQTHFDPLDMSVLSQSMVRCFIHFFLSISISIFSQNRMNFRWRNVKVIETLFASVRTVITNMWSTATRMSVADANHVALMKRKNRNVSEMMLNKFLSVVVIWPLFFPLPQWLCKRYYSFCTQACHRKTLFVGVRRVTTKSRTSVKPARSECTVCRLRTQFPLCRLGCLFFLVIGKWACWIETCCTLLTFFSLSICWQQKREVRQQNRVTHIVTFTKQVLVC